MSTIAHGIGWLWTGVLLVALGVWGLYLTGRAMGYALRGPVRRLAEAWRRGAQMREAARVFTAPLAPMEAERAARQAWEEETIPGWVREEERRAVAARLTDADRRAADEADRRLWAEAAGHDYHIHRRAG